MAVPTITSIQPARGPSLGQTLVTLTGTGMRLPPPAAVSIHIGSLPATDVAVREVLANPPDGTIATCVTPPGEPGPADVIVRNLDGSGQPIPGEAAVMPGAFTYERADLTAEPDLTRLVRTLLRALKAQVLENVSMTVHTDFDDAPGDGRELAAVAKLPALIVAGPALSENRFYSLNELPESGGGDALGLPFVQRRVPYTVDLGFTLVGVASRTAELLSLMSLCTRFVHANKHLRMLRDPENPALGHVAYEMDFAPRGELQVRSQPSDSNVRHFVGEIVVRGFDIEEPGGATLREGRTSGLVTLAVADE